MKNIYKTQSWKKIDVVIRAYLITVIEKIRKGGLLEIPWREGHDHRYTLDKKQRNLILYYIKKVGLRWLENNKNGLLYISWSEKDLKKLQNEKIPIGEFLGYPKCCQNAFYEGCKAYLRDEALGPANLFWLKQTRAIKAGTYNDDLDFTFHVPCELDCKETIEIGSKIRKVLEENDPEVAMFFQNKSKSCHS